MKITDQPELILPEQVENSSFDYLAFLGSLPKFEKRFESDVAMISADAPAYYFNAAFHARFNGNVEQRIKQVKEYFSERGRSFFVWQVTPSSQPVNLSEQIQQHGGELLESLPYMALLLHDLCRDFPVSSNFHCETVRTHEMLGAWTSIYGRARGYSESDNRLFDIFSDMDLTESSPLQLILGYLDHAPVATYSVFMGKKAAGLYSLSTLPEARGNGIGTAMSIAAADLAIAYNYTTAMLLSEHMSRNLCKRLGFVEGFGAMDIYRIPV
ncbi:MAG: GNAT family N-acetyltransferase [Anaerolineales bacterium]